MTTTGAAATRLPTTLPPTTFPWPPAKYTVNRVIPAVRSAVRSDGDDAGRKAPVMDSISQLTALTATLTAA